MPTLSDITNTVWDDSLQGFGYIVEGISCKKQQIDIAIRTSKGSDPLRLDFGTTIYLQLDKPMNIAIPNIKNEIATVIKKYVPSVTLKKITYTYTANGDITFYITYVDNDGATDTLGYLASNGTLSPVNVKIVLQASIPNNPNGYNYKLNLLLNGIDANPLEPVGGFVSIDELYNWVLINWSYLADWQKLPNKIIGYLLDPIYKTGLLSISVATEKRIFFTLADLDIDQGYTLDFTPDNSGTISSYETFYTADDLLNWAFANLSDYGNWFIEKTSGDFSGDFNGDFNQSKTQLVLYTTTYYDAVINVNVV